MRISNLAALLIAVALIIGAIVYLDSGKVATAPAASAPVVEVALSTPAPTEAGTDTPPVPAKPALSLKQMRYERAKEITTPDGFINAGLNPDGSAKPLTIGEFIGKKVILVDFWTYSCINCQRTLPYLTSWWEKYKDRGLVIIGLHTPEFEFEKKYENVLAAVKKFGIEYPVVLDNDYSTWRAYRNQYWPRKYLIDIDGYIVYDHIGEGAYEETERQIQKALEERMERLNEKGSVNVAVTKEAAVPRAGSPEIYFGASRNEHLGSGTRGKTGTQTFEPPSEVTLNTLYLVGLWDIKDEYAEAQWIGKPVVGAIDDASPHEIIFKYRAKEVYFVASSDDGVEVKIYNDGTLVRGRGSLVCSEQGFCGGEDVSQDGTAYIKEDRLYKLIENKGIEEHVLKIEIPRSLKAFTFTFG